LSGSSMFVLCMCAISPNYGKVLAPYYKSILQKHFTGGSL
jgi:hypothetical protein